MLSYTPVLKLVLHPNILKRNETLYKNSSNNFETKTTIYNKESRMNKFATCTTLAIGLAMLIGPLWMLQFVTAEGFSTRNRLLIITVFLIAFAVLVSVMTVARPPEVLGATAAYGAVLMVFMQLQSSGST